MNVQFPSDTPEWLKATLADLDVELKDRIIKAESTDQIVAARGELKLFVRICDEIDVMGRVEKDNVVSINKEAAKRG